MPEWEKVRIQFTDADGNEVSAAMYKEPRGDYYVTKNGGGACVMESRDLTVVPIRELPTGVGAVIAVKGEGDDDLILSRDAGGWWNSLNDAYDSDTVANWQYEILSEGIQL